MEERPGNPSANRLPEGIKEEVLVAAVEASGYPLQTVIARFLAGRDWLLTEEWGYTDPDTGSARTLDIRARLPLLALEEGDRRQFWPTLDLLIECKQSELPYVFFSTASRPFVTTFPRVVGQRQKVPLQGDDSGRTWEVPILQALGGTAEEFVAGPPVVASSLAKAERAGKRIRLSGDETYRGLVEPLLKATDHYAGQLRWTDTGPFRCRVTVPIALLDAPMVVVQIAEESPELSYAPWVRVLRHEGSPPDRRRAVPDERLLAIDVVHRDFFENYLDRGLDPFAREIVHRVESLRDAFNDRPASYAPGLIPGAPIPDDLHRRIRPMRNRPS